MGKKSTFKKIRRIASAMPVINTRHIQGDIVKGEKLIAAGVKQVEGKEVVATLNYREKRIEKVPLNHNRKMKKLYYMAGVNGVRHYIEAVKQYQAANK